MKPSTKRIILRTVHLVSVVSASGHLDKLVDELAKGKKMKGRLRKEEKS